MGVSEPLDSIRKKQAWHDDDCYPNDCGQVGTSHFVATRNITCQLVPNGVSVALFSYHFFPYCTIPFSISLRYFVLVYCFCFCVARSLRIPSAFFLSTTTLSFSEYILCELVSFIEF